MKALGALGRGSSGGPGRPAAVAGFERSRVTQPGEPVGQGRTGESRPRTCWMGERRVALGLALLRDLARQLHYSGDRDRPSSFCIPTLSPSPSAP